VNGETITVSQWIERMKMLRAQDFLVSTNPLRFKSQYGGQIALESLIANRLLYQYAARLSLLPSNADIEREVEARMKDPAIAAAVSKGQLSAEQLRETVRFGQTVYNIATVNQTVSPDEVKAFYEKNAAAFGTPETWRLSVIRVSGEAARAAVEAEIKKGTAFEAIAKRYSEDATTKERGGDLGVVTANDSRIPSALRDAIKTLKPGQVSDAIQAPAGPGGKPVLFFVKLVARTDAVTRPLEQVQEQARRGALIEKAGGLAVVDRKVEEFRKTSKIEIKLPGYTLPEE